MTNLSSTQIAIHNSARQHFMKDGFERASLNQIIKETGFTKGAFYGYYDSKEELFEALVQDTKNGIETILKSVTDRLQKYDEIERIYHMTDVFLDVLPELVDFILDHHEDVVILLSRANGTKYEHFLENIQVQNERHGNSNLRNHYGRSLIEPETYHIMMSGYFSMLKQIFLSEMTRDEMITSVSDIQWMYQSGIMALMRRKVEESH